MLDYAGVDDSVVVTAISRLGRSVAEVTGPSQNSQSDESCCAPCVKASTPPPPHRSSRGCDHGYFGLTGTEVRSRAPGGVSRISPSVASTGNPAAQPHR